MRKLLLPIAAIALALGVASTAEAGDHKDHHGAPCTTAPQEQWLSLETLITKTEALGYKVQGAKLKNACGKLSAIDKNGGHVKLLVDPTSGKIVDRP
jgi:hypothetical protein